MTSPVNSNAQLHAFVSQFEKATTPIETNLTLEKIMKFINENKENISTESLNEFNKAIKGRMQKLKEFPENIQIQQIFFRLTGIHKVVTKMIMQKDSIGLQGDIERKET